MSNGLLTIGSSALDAAYTALRTTGNNIANVSTPGYSREVTSFAPTVQTTTGSLYIGTGVAVDAVSRVYNDFLGQQTNLAQAMSSQADTTAKLTGQINNMFSDPTTGLGAAVDNFFTQLQTLTAQPASAAVRQTVLSSAQQMAGQFNSAFGQLQEMNQSAQQQLGQEVSSVNTTVAQIANLNSQIALATASGQSPNSLLDQRNQDILTLNQAIGVTTTPQSDGSINVFLANGQPLLVGSKTYALTMGQDPVNPQGIVVGTSNGATIAALDPNNSGGGAIGALLQFQSQTIPSVENQIGRLAVTLSSQLNALQAQGSDLNGNPGSNFFSVPSIAVTAAATNSDASSVSLGASFSDVTKLQASDYRVSIQGSNYTVTRLSDGSTVASGTVASLPGTVVDGMRLSVSGGTPATGDVFTIQPAKFGATNLSVALTQGAQIAAASPLQASVSSALGSTLAVGALALAPLSANPGPNLNPNPNPNLLAPVTLTFLSPTQFSYTPTGSPPPPVVQSYSAGQPININGWSLTLNGTPAAGDTVSVTAAGLPGSSDNRNALLMTQLQSQAMVSGSTLDSAYSTLVANVGAIASAAQTDQASKNAILQNATMAQSSVSGVNLDEEAAKLMQYQQQYQAAAKLIQTANNIFDAILAVAAAA